MSLLVIEQLEPISRFFGKRGLVELSVNEKGRVWTQFVGRGYEEQPAPDITRDWAWDLCKFLANVNGVVFREEMPVLACRLPGGHRFQAVLGANVESGISISVRIKRKVNIGYDAFGLVSGKPVEEPPDLYDAAGSDGGQQKVGTLEDLLDVVRRGKPVLVSGGTSTGKTTLLNKLVHEIPAHKRPITVEDTREVDLPHANQVNLLVSRTETGTNVTYGTILDSILRLNPDVILLGEVSVDNAYPLLRVLNTGHEGFLGTVHANNPLEALEAIKRNIELAGHRAEGAIPFLARTIARIVQIKHLGGDRREVVSIVRPKDLPWKDLIS